jgi:monothiol glutaredoxin
MLRAMPLDDTTRDQIQTLIDGNPVMLFMKGHREAPQCGFSARVIQMLDQLVSDYTTFDVLSSGTVREGIKEFSSWPTIPQLYVKGEFIGGCDIITELFETGELLDTFGIAPGDVAPPNIEITDAAAQSIRESLQGMPTDQALHLGIDARYQAKLFVTPPAPNSVQVEVQSIVMHLDPLSAQRAEGASIDLVKTNQGVGFRVHLPNAPEL